MRLRAVLQGGRRLQDVLRLMERVSKTVLVLMSPEDVTLVANPGAVDSLQTWATLSAASGDGEGLFKTYRIESLNSNNIGFETDLAQFQRALKTAENAEVATMKLSSKSGRPFMSFEIIIKTGDLMMTSIQDVPIRLLGVEEHNNTTEPDIGDPIVRLCVPELRALYNVTERLKQIDVRIELKANMAGELQLGAETDFAFMTNYWRDLEIPPVTGGVAPVRDPARKASVVVDCSQLLRIFSSHQIRPGLSMCLVVQRAMQKLLIWHVVLGGGDTITYYCPVLE